MVNPVKATAQFKRNFEIVCRAYKCPADEIEIMKQCARNDMQAAEESFGLMAKKLIDLTT